MHLTSTSISFVSSFAKKNWNITYMIPLSYFTKDNYLRFVNLTKKKTWSLSELLHLSSFPSPPHSPASLTPFISRYSAPSPPPHCHPFIPPSRQLLKLGGAAAIIANVGQQVPGSIVTDECNARSFAVESAEYDTWCPSLAPILISRWWLQPNEG